MANVTDRPIAKHLSVSQLNEYLKCSWRYYLHRILGWEERPSLPLANGKAGHAAVEFNQLNKIKTKADAPLDKILDLFSDSYDAQTYELDPSDVDPKEIGSTKDSTIETLKVYRAIDAPKTQPILVEVPFTLTIPPIEGQDDNVPPVVGRIDYLHTDGLGDNKFAIAHRKKSQAEVDTSDQLTTYDAGMQQQGVVVPRLGLKVFLPGNTKNTPDVQNLLRDPRLMQPEVRQNRIERLYYKFRTAWRGIQAGIFIPTDNPITCGMCPFRERCQYNLIKSDYDALQIQANRN